MNAGVKDLLMVSMVVQGFKRRPGLISLRPLLKLS